jgi:hypothetical protein
MGLRTKKVFARIGVVLVLVVSLGLGIRAIFNYTNGKKLEKYLTKLKNEGKPLSRLELASPCPDRDNGAHLWKAAEAVILIEGDDKTFLAKARDFFDWKAFDETDGQRFEEIVNKNRRVIDLVTEAATKSCFRYGDWRKPGYEIEIPDAVKMIQAIRMLTIDALLKAEKGRTEEAVDQILKGMTFCQLCLDESILIGYLVSMANAKTLLFNLNRIISGRELSTETLMKIMSALDPEVWRRGMARTFESENAHFCLNTYTRIIRGEIITGLNSSLFDRACSWLFRPVIKSEIVWTSSRREEMSRAALLPYYENEKTRLQHDQQMEKIPLYYRLTKLVLPHLSAVMMKEATLEAMIDAARIGLACRIYRNEEGRFPEKIADLVPHILGREPLDPFTGKSFIYTVRENGFIVYSVGTNKKDDLGKGSEITQMVMEKDDDWAWRENWGF